MIALKIQDLSKNFGSTEVLKKINLEINEGNFLVLLGPSGCGKSTLLNIVAGLETIDEGEVFIDDYNVSKVEPKDRNIAMVFQSYALYPSMNVKENITFGLKQSKTPKDKIEEQLKKISTFLHVDELLNRKPSQLSGGQRQRVAIGRALVREPRIFLFDEPLSNLDAKLRVEMRREIKKLHQKLKTTVVYVTHDQTEAMSLGTYIAIMNHGVIQQYDTPENIYNKPNNTFVADFIGSPSMNLISGQLVKNGNNTSFIPKDSNQSNNISIKNYNFIKPLDESSKDVYFGIRPEHIHYKKTNDTDFEVNLKADLNEYIGHEQIITFNYSNQEVLGKFSSTVKIEMSKEMKLYFDLNQISIFDKKTNNRI
jgi:multiple sugar transport system ATP-binding protein